MKRIFKPICFAGLFLLASCVDDISKMNTDPKQYSSVPGDMLYSNAVRNLADGITYGVTFKVLAQQWSETTYTDASRYNLPNVGNGFWNTVYRDVLRDLKEATRLVEAAPTGNLVGKQNKLALIEIMNVYSFSLLVNTYGDIPYSEALDSDNLAPAYDDAETIYDDLFVRLDAAIAALDPDGDSFGAQDLIYGGDVAKWIKFAQSLKLRMAMTLSDFNASKAGNLAQAAFASGDLFDSNDDNALLVYDAAPPNTNQIWVNLVQSGREDYVASNTMVDYLEARNDPREEVYFTVDGDEDDDDGAYSGGTFGTSNNYGNFSKAGDMVVDPGFPGTFLDYSEVEFYLAEAVSRGFIAGSVEEHYNKAIQASMDYWGVMDASGADADDDGLTDEFEAYVAANANVAFATAAGTDLEKIALQKYLALYNRGLEAWTEYRRFDAPVLNVVPDPLGDFPIRYTYPVNEQNLNGVSWAAAVAKIPGGEDDVTKRVFWDVD